MKGFKGAGSIMLATGAAVTLVAAACTSAPSDETSEEVTLTFWWWGDENRAALTQEQIDLFEEKNPDIHVDGQPQAFDNYFANLSTSFAGGNAPDVITMGGSYPLSYAAEGNLVDLSTAEGIDISPFSAEILSSASLDGGVYGVPSGGNSLAVFANPVIFNQAGVELPDDSTWSWQDFADLATEISAGTPDDIYGAEMRSYDLIGAFAGQSTPLYDADGNLTVTADTLEELWQLEADLVASGGLPPADLMQEVMTVEPALTLFGQGRSALFFGYTNQLRTYAEAAGNPADGTDDVVVLRIPGEAQAAQPGTTLLPSQYFTINADTPHPEAAAKFVDFLVNDPGSGAIIGANRGMPSNASVLDAIAADLGGYDQAVAEFLSANLDSFGPAFLPPAWATELNTITQNVDSEVIFGTLTPAEAAASWIDQMEASKEANS